MSIKLSRLYVTLLATILIISWLLNFTLIRSQINENRNLASLPSLGLLIKSPQKFTKEYEKYFEDNFILHSVCIKINNWLKRHIFKTSSKKVVLLGKNNWLFYNAKNDGEPIADYLGTNLFTLEELNIISNKLISWNNWMQKKGIIFIIMIPPNKEEVFSEFLPNSINKKAKNSLTRVQQLIDHLDNKLKIIYSINKLQKSKYLGKLYYCTDTHWTPLGAFLYYQDLYQELHEHFSSIPYSNLDDFRVKMNSLEFIGDLANMITLDEKEFYTEIIHNPVIPYSITSLPNESLPSSTIVTKTDNLSLPKAVIFRDSFFINLLPFVAPNFSKSTYIWNYEIDYKLIEQEQPNVVILEIVERHIGLLRDIPSAFID
ncbi:alginate O-acetyltransferase AlgX-related protein [Rickettsia endosymbiont of Halotydeus destructor]|uniref:alginate O-acetyltransferase AlgX-related protein n=1 Tax=Rickettsia endosymbiont of Halotydeus destructor TaxID=2996754 RepID=UPI003BB1C45A